MGSNQRRISSKSQKKNSHIGEIDDKDHWSEQVNLNYIIVDSCCNLLKMLANLSSNECYAILISKIYMIYYYSYKHDILQLQMCVEHNEYA